MRDVHVVSLDGRDAHRITDDPADDMEPLWSPDSRRIVFKSNRLGSVSLWTVEVKDGKPVGQPVKLKDGMQSARLIDWNERGIFYEEQISTWDVYTAPMDPVEQRATGSPQQIPYSRTGRNVSPVWSPDGAKLAFVSSVAADPDRRYVVVMPAGGGEAREFLIPTTKWLYTQSPYDLRWFGDGRGLGFSGLDTRGAPAVFRLLLATGEWDTIPLSSGLWRTTIEWNRDGSAFYFSRQTSEDGGIFERAVGSDNERPIYRPSTPVINLHSLEFSPDRKWLAFQQFTSGDANAVVHRILIVDVATGETRTIRETLSDSSAPNLVGWTPSGEVLLDPRGSGGAGEILLVPVNGGSSRSLQTPRSLRAGLERRDPI